jgi:hypothetical protein
MSVHANSDPTLIHVTIVNNMASVGYPGGGGIFISGSYYLTIINSIVWGNCPVSIYFETEAFDQPIDDEAVIIYSDITGGYEGEGNIDTDPLFVYGGDGGCECSNTDNGATNSFGDDCVAYVGNPGWCGVYDDSDFDSNAMCCECGGGSDGSDGGGGGDSGDDGKFILQEDSPCIDAGTAYLEWEGEIIVDIPESDYTGSAPDMGAFEFDGTSIQGDLNGDGQINVQDVVALVNIILGAAPEVSSADYNGDGLINVLDVVEMVTFILRGND